MHGPDFAHNCTHQSINNILASGRSRSSDGAQIVFWQGLRSHRVTPFAERAAVLLAAAKLLNRDMDATAAPSFSSTLGVSQHAELPQRFPASPIDLNNRHPLVNNPNPEGENGECSADKPGARKSAGRPALLAGGPSRAGQFFLSVNPPR